MEQLTNNEIAHREGLNVVSTTTNNTGYPSHVDTAIVGFDSFEAAREIAEKYDKDVVLLHQRNGWDFWYNNYKELHEAPELCPEDLGYLQCYDNTTSEEDVIEEMLDRLSCLNSLDGIAEEVQLTLKMFNAIRKLTEDEVLFAYLSYDPGMDFEVVKKHPVSWSYDSHCYMVAVC